MRENYGRGGGGDQGEAEARPRRGRGQSEGERAVDVTIYKEIEGMRMVKYYVIQRIRIIFFENLISLGYCRYRTENRYNTS
jgi:hypothetical protein